MRPVTTPLKMIVNEIRKSKIAKIRDLVKTLKCSVWTLFHQIREYGYYTSINFNRRYITLKDIPTFDANGIWEYQGVIFSQWGNVENTIINLVNMSPVGLSVGEITDILQIRTHNQLHRCIKNRALVRFRQGRNQIYFSVDEKLQKHQTKEREKRLEKTLAEPSARPRYITNKVIIDTLVAIIKHHETSPEAIISIMASEGIKVNERTVKWVLKKYEIEKKRFQ